MTTTTATTRPRLGELLLANGVVSREKLREAWEQKVIYGDRLGTNLLALGAIDEHALASALGQQHGVHSGYGRVIAPEKSVMKLVPKAVAVRRFLVPHHVVDKQLYVLMRDPLDHIALEEVAFASNLRVVPVVACEARIWQLLELHYKTVVSLRPVPLDGVRPRPAAAVDDPSGSAALGPELTSEEEFQRLYAGIHASPAPAETAEELPPPPTTGLDDVHPPVSASGEGDEEFGEDAALLDKTTPGRPAAILAASDPAGERGLLAPPRKGEESQGWREAIEKTQPMMARPRLTVTSEQGDPEPVMDLVEVMEPAMERQQTADFHVEVQDVVVDESPLSFADATRVLSAATDRNAIARTVLRAARTRFQRACLLTVYPDRIVGWMGIGDGMQSERMRDVVVSRKEKSVFALVAESRSHYLGPLQRFPAHGGWVKATGRKIPKSLAVFPILVRGRPINLLVVDNGHDQFVGSDVGEVLILAQQIAKTYETLLTSG